ncbi:hypothetical protein LDO98_20410, partial [Paenarthrobacter aurescens]|uniref:hypothetical protein n=1 Tax=Paenarthrobacter aurescens TaxID=43663 RepID=UPI0026E2330C
PINKTIGINKLGTLLSSQTTDTPGTNQNPHRSRNRSGATFQTYPNQPHKANQNPGLPHHPAAHKSTTETGEFERESVAIFPHQRRRLE